MILLIIVNQKVTTVDRKITNPNQLSWDDFKSGVNGLGKAADKANQKVDAIVTLTGASIIDKEWDEARRAELLSSRVDPIKLLVDNVLQLPASERPEAFVASSAVGIYSTTTPESHIHDESDVGIYADTYPSLLVQQWEAASVPINDVMRRSVVRISLVLGKDGGVLKQSLLPGGVFCLGKVGNGLQPYPWIHMDDLVGQFTHCIENKNVKGVLNGVAPQLITQGQFADALEEASGRWQLPAPEFLTKLMFGQRSVLLLDGPRVVAKPKTSSTGFTFKYPTIKSALHDLLSPHPKL